ncbi:hypothetical protein J4411_01830 [Candidatus Pacearchaeota archaeon]|nr:hypothetical protein [Candidatus Pacearchaeota archaeon]
MKSKKYNVGKPSYTLSKEPKMSELLRKIGITAIGIITIGALYSGGKKIYENYQKAPNMVMNAKGIENYVVPGMLWDAYIKEREMNGFVHNQETWAAYIKRTKELNNEDLNNIRYTPDANGNGCAD